MKLVLLSILLIISSLALSQIKTFKQITIVDLNSKQPVPFTTIRSLEFKIGIYANENGRFELSDNFGDSLYITSIGYISKKLIKKDIFNDTINLEPQIVELQPLTIKQRKFIKKEQFGVTKANNSLIWTSAGYGDEFAQKIFFPDTTKVYRVKTIKIAAERFEPEIPMLLHIYNTGSDGFPKADILLKKVLLKKEDFKKAKKCFIIDLSSENIMISANSFFVGLEWLPVSAKGEKLPTTAIILTDQFKTLFTFSRGFFYAREKWGETLRTPGQANPNNTIISVEVDILE